ncbi:MAG: ribokinase [Clostridia bacterium]|nr:ribokinase [Clostridia bacterium]
MQNRKITVIGSYNTDLTVTAPHLPADGESIIGSALEYNPGGKGSNQAVAAHKAGADVTLLAKLGRDSMSKTGLDLYEKIGLDTSHIVYDDKNNTGTALIEVDGRSGENRIIVIPGSNMNITKEDVLSVSERIKDSDILLIQLEINEDAIKEAVRTAKEYGTKIVLNPAPYSDLALDLIKDVDYITPNETEAAFISGVRVDGAENAPEAAEKMLSMGAKNVIITLGSHGSYYKGESGEIIMPTRKVKRVDTTGAGDAYNGAFCCALSEGKSVYDAMRFADAFASISVTRKGAASSMPTREEALEFMNS